MLQYGNIEDDGVELIERSGKSFGGDEAVVHRTLVVAEGGRTRSECDHFDSLMAVPQQDGLLDWWVALAAQPQRHTRAQSGYDQRRVNDSTGVHRLSAGTISTTSSAIGEGRREQCVGPGVVSPEAPTWNGMSFG